MNDYSKASKVLFFCGLFLISFIFFNISISTLLFIFKITILKFNAFLALFFSILSNYYFIKKSKENNLSFILITTIIPILLIAFSIFVSGKFYDYTFDGNSYHKASIGEMMNGWNPLYEQMEEYDKNSSNKINVAENSYVWANHYAKASHIFAANIGKITNNIESGKSINIISILILFMFTLSFILYESKFLFFSVLFSLCISTFTTISSQFLTNYVDILVYIYFFLLILVFFMFEKFSLFKNKDNYLALYLMTLVIGINIKFSLFAYAGIYCLGYFIWYILRFKNKKIDKLFFKKFIITSAISLIIAVFVVGLSVYPKNYYLKGNIFYPLMGDNKIDIMTSNQPDYFKDKSPIEKFNIATFSRVSNISEIDGLEATYKIPFSVYSEEIKISNYCDLRISGNGVFYSGILIISFILLMINIIKEHKKDKTLFYLIIIPTTITIAMIFLLNESWWARYFPQLNLIVLFSLILLIKNNTKVNNALLFMIIGIILVNNFISFEKSLNHVIDFTKESNKQYYAFENNYKSEDCNLKLYTNVFHGALFNIMEREEKYNIEYITDKNQNYDTYDYFMNGFVYWRCEE